MGMECSLNAKVFEGGVDPNLTGGFAAQLQVTVVEDTEK